MTFRDASPRAALILAWILFLTACGLSVCWLASFRKGDYVDRAVIIEHFGRSGSNWYLDCLRGQVRVVINNHLALKLSCEHWP